VLIEYLSKSNAEWKYDGSDVLLGDDSRALCRWGPIAGNYLVLYGSLRAAWMREGEARLPK